MIKILTILRISQQVARFGETFASELEFRFSVMIVSDWNWFDYRMCSRAMN